MTPMRRASKNPPPDVPAMSAILERWDRVDDGV